MCLTKFFVDMWGIFTIPHDEQPLLQMMLSCNGVIYMVCNRSLYDQFT